MNKDVLDLFGVVVIDAGQKNPSMNTDLADRGVVLDFDPTNSQRAFLRAEIEPLPLKTLFSKEERNTLSAEELIAKQLLNYFETYDIGMPGLFGLEFDGCKTINIRYIRGVTREELGDLVRSVIYANAPIADSVAVVNIIREFDVFYDLSKVKNNESKLLLFRESKDVFDDGDDAVRYVCFKATESPMLIKSKEVIDAISSKKPVSSKFLEKHALVLSRVFNRHKKLILAAKTKENRAAINRITRLSKTNHVPIREHISKTFIAKALENPYFDVSVLEKIDTRSLFKYLNLLAYKRMQKTVDSFVIRNGKIHIEEGRKVFKSVNIDRVESAVLGELSNRLSHLKTKVIVLDEKVDYGLPISRKQTVGKLPFGTTVEVEGKISSGIFWKNEWGATDLDLSTVDMNGNRVGWGRFSGYGNDEIHFSGDMTYAPGDGAMEFMTSAKSTYGLFTNIYSGQPGAEMEVVCGSSNGNRWIDEPIIREKVKLNSRGMVTGFVRNNKFIVWMGRLNENRANFNEVNPVIARASAEQWTVKTLFDLLGIKYFVDNQEVSAYNLQYKSFSYDKLEELLLEK